MTANERIWRNAQSAARGQLRTVKITSGNHCSSASAAVGGRYATKMASMSASALDEGSLTTLSDRPIKPAWLLIPVACAPPLRQTRFCIKGRSERTLSIRHLVKGARGIEAIRQRSRGEGYVHLQLRLFYLS